MFQCLFGKKNLLDLIFFAIIANKRKEETRRERMKNSFHYFESEFIL